MSTVVLILASWTIFLFSSSAKFLERLPNTTGLLNELLECFLDSTQNFTLSRISLFLTGIVLERDILLLDSDVSMQARN